MTKEEILQGKKLIAKFRALPFFFGKPYNNDIEQWEIAVDVIVNTEDLQYNTSWDWLMPVVTSCKLKGLDIEMRGFNVRVYRPYIKIYNCPEKDFDMVDREKYITPVFIAVTDFITWLNQQPKQNQS